MKILKKLIFSLSFILLNISIVLAQEQIICGTSTVNSTTNSIDCKKKFTDNLSPVRTIKLNFHFIENKAKQGFTHDNSNPALNGNSIAQNLIQWGNYFLQSRPQLTLLPQFSFTGDLNYRYRLYTDPNNTNDSYGGIWYHPSSFDYTDVTKLEYGEDVMHVIIEDRINDFGTFGIAEPQGGYFLLFNIYAKTIAQTPGFNLFKYHETFDHEVFHMLGVNHTFNQISGQSPNPCWGVDINQDLECNQQTPCDNWNSGGNNLMGGTGSQKALSICQREQIENFFKENNPKWLYDCDDVILTNDFIIDNHSNNIWDETRFIDSDIIVKTGSQLVIQCKVKMGSNRRIVVERGAKLIINAGSIDKLCADRWDGIYVHGNNKKIQPDPETLFNLLAPDDAGIVIIKNTAKLKFARTAISTSAPGYSYSDQVARWGGVIKAENSTFENNQRAVEFMRYNIQDANQNLVLNKSSFSGCSFLVDDATDGSTVGVTLWDTHGVKFETNTFGDALNKSIQRFADHIYGIDFSAEITDGNFFHNPRYQSIVTETTYPYINAQLNIDGNFFRTKFSSSRAIALFTYNNAPYKTKITNNDFKGLYRYCINIPTSTSFEISGNSIENINSNFNYSSIRIRDIGQENSGIINCNDIEDQSTAIAIGCSGNNERVVFPGNNFRNSIRSINLLTGASVLGTQSWAQVKGKNIVPMKYPSSNLFLKSVKDRIINKTGLPFTYYTPELVSQWPDYFPDNIGQNFALDFYDSKPPRINCEPVPTVTNSTGFPPIGDCTRDYVIEARVRLGVLDQAIIGNKENQDLRFIRDSVYMDLYENINCTGTYLLESRRFEELESFLAEQPEPVYKRFVYGVKVRKGAYEEAKSYLHTLPIENQDDEWFIKVQDINLKRFNEEAKYHLTTSEESFLETVANSKSKERFYARAVLNLLSERRYYEDDDEAEYRSMQVYTADRLKNDTRKGQVFITPNPLIEAEAFFINIKDTKITNGTILMRNMLGNLVFTKKITADKFTRLTIDCPYLEPGLYIINVLEGEIPLLEDKIFIAR